MVSYTKSSFVLFFASCMNNAVNGHRLPENFDTKKFAVDLKKLSQELKEEIKDQGSKKVVKAQKGSEANQLRVRSAMDTSKSSKGKSTGKGKGKSKGSDVTSEEGNLLPGSETDPDAFLDGHEFRAASPTDSRGPCPFINVMANHGFINRNGRDVPAFVIPELATILFDLPSEGFIPIVNLAIFDGQVIVKPNGETLLDIERLWNRPGEERDASQVFPNPGVVLTEDNELQDPTEGFTPQNDETFTSFRYNIDQGLLDQLLSKAVDGYLTQEHHNEFLKERIIDSRLNDHFFRFSEEDLAVASGQFVLPCLILGDDVKDFSFVDADHINGLWSEFRFPVGYAPRRVRHGESFDAAFYQEERERFSAINADTAHDALERELGEGMAPPIKLRKNHGKNKVNVATA